MERIEEIDAKILKDLLKDGRKDLAEIAKEIGVSKNTIWKHYKEMMLEGIIVGATTQVDFSKLGYYAIAELYARNKGYKKEQIEEIIRKIPDTILVYLSRNIVILRLLREMAELESLKNIIRQNFSFGDLKTSIWTGSVKTMPDNLSFGLPSKLTSEVGQTKTEQIAFETRKIEEIDEKDRAIINKLTENGRSSFRKIAEEIGVTTDTVARRYRELKRNGILNVAIQISPEKIGYNATLECRVELISQNSISSTIEALSKVPDVVGITGTSGDYDLHIWILIRDFKHLFAMQEKIASIPYFGRMDLDINEVFLKVFPTPGQQITVMKEVSKA